MFYLIMPSLELRQELIAPHEMRRDRHAVPLRPPLHSAPGGRFGRTFGEMTNTDDLSARLVRLPLYPQMGDAVNRVLERLSHHLDDLL